MISDIKQLSPAEMLFLQEPNRLNGRQMMRVTLMDLIVKGVLQIQRISTDPEKPIYVISPDTYFYQYPPLFHEEPFLEPFRMGGKIMELYLLANLVTQRCGSYHGYQFKYVRKSPRLMDLLPKNFWNTFHVFPGTKASKELRQDLNARLGTGQNIVTASLNQQQVYRLAELPLLLGSGLLLIESLGKALSTQTYPEAWLQELTLAYAPLQNLFKRPVTENDAETGVGYYGGIGDAFGGCSGDGGSGCGGDGGCSGDGGGGCSGGSGCGGGGCGGGGCGS